MWSSASAERLRSRPLVGKAARRFEQENMMSIEIPALAPCPKCNECVNISTELHPGTSFVRCDACKPIGPELMPKRDMSKPQRLELLAAVIRAWNNLPR